MVLPIRKDGYLITADWFNSIRSEILSTTSSSVISQSLDAITTINHNDKPLETSFISGNGTSVELVSNPQVKVGAAQGDTLILVGTSDLNTVRLNDGNGLSLKSKIIMGLNDILVLIWTGSVWAESSRSETIITTSANQSVDAITGISHKKLKHETIFVSGNAAPVEITSSPSILAGNSIGDRLTIVGTNSTNTVQINDGNGVSINGVAILEENNIIDLIWTGSVWAERSRSF